MRLSVIALAQSWDKSFLAADRPSFFNVCTYWPNCGMRHKHRRDHAFRAHRTLIYGTITKDQMRAECDKGLAVRLGGLVSARFFFIL